MQRIFIGLGSIAVLAITFLSTLYLIDSSEFQSMDDVRVEHAKSLRTALEKYHSVRGAYPAPFTGNDVAELNAELVGGGFISSIPEDPYWKKGKVNRYRYRSDGSTYGILFIFDVGECQIGTGKSATDTWAGHTVPRCPF